MVLVLPAFEVALAAVDVGIRALAGAKGALAAFKDQCLTAGRVQELGNGRGGCGNASGEQVLFRGKPCSRDSNRCCRQRQRR